MDRPRMARRFSARSLAEAPGPLPFCTFRPAAKASDPDELFIYDEIGFSWYDEGITAASFAKQLAALKSDRLTLRINSPGGDVFDGLAIGNLLREHKATKTVKVDALAASIASVIAVMASSGDDDELIMGPYSQFMIHDASGFGYGNASDLRELAELLDMISNNIATVYADRAGGTAADWRKVMKGEKWYSATEAVEAGLADSAEGAKRKGKCSECGGEGCDECDGTGMEPSEDDDESVDNARRSKKCKMSNEDAERLQVAAQWCERLFPGHEGRFRDILAASDASDPAPLDPAPSAPTAQGSDGTVSDTPSDAVPSASPVETIELEQLPLWDSATLDTLRSGINAAIAPPQIDLNDWRAWFAEAPAMAEPDRNAPVDLGPPPARPEPPPEPPRNPLAEMIGAAVNHAASSQPDLAPPDRNAPVDLGPPPARPEPPPEPPRNVLAELVGAAVNLAANDRPEPTPSRPAEAVSYVIPSEVPFRLDASALRRAIRESRY